MYKYYFHMSQFFSHFSRNVFEFRLSPNFFLWHFGTEISNRYIFSYNALVQSSSKYRVIRLNFKLSVNYYVFHSLRKILVHIPFICMVETHSLAYFPPFPPSNAYFLIFCLLYDFQFYISGYWIIVLCITSFYRHFL